MKNTIVGQSGGPTSVINSSLAGVFEAAKSRGSEHVYGMCNGIQGFLEDRYVDLVEIFTKPIDIELLKRTPSSYLGSCRYKLPDINDDGAKELIATWEAAYWQEEDFANCKPESKSVNEPVPVIPLIFVFRVERLLVKSQTF